MGNSFGPLVEPDAPIHSQANPAFLVSELHEPSKSSLDRFARMPYRECEIVISMMFDACFRPSVL